MSVSELRNLFLFNNYSKLLMTLVQFKTETNSPIYITVSTFCVQKIKIFHTSIKHRRVITAENNKLKLPESFHRKFLILWNTIVEMRHED